jgi:hypothetical protein
MRLVASLTTIPDRIDKIKNVIHSLSNQTRKFDKIYLNIPYRSKKGKTYTIPSFLDDYPDVTILRFNIDYGPITKLIPVLNIEKDPETRIVTFDDDTIVDKSVSKILEERSKKYGNSCLSFSGFNIGYFPFLLEYNYVSTKDVEMDWIQGTHAILYIRKLIDKKELLFMFSDCPYDLTTNDDHKISMYLRKKKVPKIVLKENAYDLFTTEDHCKISAISNNGSMIKFDFIKNIYNIGTWAKSKGLYHNTMSKVKSMGFYAIICIMIFSVIVFHCYKNVNFIPVYFVLLVLFIINRSYISSLFKKTTII